jgi:hypothetical protein
VLCLRWSSPGRWIAIISPFLEVSKYMDVIVCPPEGGLGSYWLKHALKQIWILFKPRFLSAPMNIS